MQKDVDSKEGFRSKVFTLGEFHCIIDCSNSLLTLNRKVLKIFFSNLDSQFWRLVDEIAGPWCICYRLRDQSRISNSMEITPVARWALLKSLLSPIFLFEKCSSPTRPADLTCSEKKKNSRYLSWV